METLASLSRLKDPIWASFCLPERKKEFESELSWRNLIPIFQQEHLYIFRGKFEPICWAQVNWKDVEVLEFQSIGDAAARLKKIGPQWMFFSNGFHRRGSLVQEKFRNWKPLQFPLTKNPFEKVGGFSLLSEGILICSKIRDRLHPTGSLDFVDDPTAPSRAYKKIWEGLSEVQQYPSSGETCLELGASPGGWTYVLLQLGSNVIAWDRSPLDPKIHTHKNLRFHQGDAFQAKPEKVGQIDWLFSDLICYPEKLAEFVKPWLEQKKKVKMICTLKFQGEFDPKVLSFFCEYGKVVHLNANKNELTWFANFE